MSVGIYITKDSSDKKLDKHHWRTQMHNHRVCYVNANYDSSEATNHVRQTSFYSPLKWMFYLCWIKLMSKWVIFLSVISARSLLQQRKQRKSFTYSKVSYKIKLDEHERRSYRRGAVNSTNDRTSAICFHSLYWFEACIMKPCIYIYIINRKYLQLSERCFDTISKTQRKNPETDWWSRSEILLVTKLSRPFLRPCEVLLDMWTCCTLTCIWRIRP